MGRLLSNRKVTILLLVLAVVIGFRFFRNSMYYGRNSVEPRYLPLVSLDALDTAEEKWQTVGLRDYDLDLKFIAEARTSLIHVEVRNGIAVRMTRDGIEELKPEVCDEWTIDSQLRQIRERLAPDAIFRSSHVEGSQMSMYGLFDENFGFPSDYSRQGFGSAVKFHIRVIEFAPKLSRR